MAKKRVKYSVVDAFTESPFKGNPAAVCLLEEERDQKWMQAVAAEFNLSETSFLTRIAHPNRPLNSRFSLRWFTPVHEVNLCGHATLAASHDLFSFGLVDSSIIEYETLSGVLTAEKFQATSVTSASSYLQSGDTEDGFYIELNFPVDPLEEYNSAEISQISGALNVKAASIVDIRKTQIGNDIFVVLESGTSVPELQPEIDELVKCPASGVIVTGAAPSESGFDFFSRYFFPKGGINEDPVTGSAHCSLATYWSKKLEKCDLNAYQASPRGGALKVHLDDKNQRVLLRGKAVTLMKGCILV